MQAGCDRRKRIANLPGPSGPVDFTAVFNAKLPLLEEAAANFLDHAGDEARARFLKFSTPTTPAGSPTTRHIRTCSRRRFGYAS